MKMATKHNPLRIAVLMIAVATLLAAWSLVLGEASKPAQAAFPGKNGKIAFQSSQVTLNNPQGDLEIYKMNPDGSGVKQLTSEGGEYPNWQSLP